MEKFSTLQLVVGTFGVMFVVVSATFAGYWNLFGKKNRTVSKQELPRTVNPGLRQARAGYQQ
jgi:hypothetical protein